MQTLADSSLQMNEEVLAISFPMNQDGYERKENASLKARQGRRGFTIRTGQHSRPRQDRHFDSMFDDYTD